MAFPAAAATLTDAQRAAVDHGTGTLVLRGAARSGRTTAVVARWCRLVDDGAGAHEVLVLARDADAARRLRAEVLAIRPGAGAGLRVTSPWALAFDVVRRSGGDVVFAARARSRAVLVDAIRSLDDDALAALAPHGLTDGVITEVAALAAEAADDAALDTAHARAAAAGCGPRWAAAVEAVRRHRDELRTRGLHDQWRLFHDAAAAIAGGALDLAHLIADDLGSSTGGSHGAALVPAIAGRAASTLIAAGLDDELPPAIEAAAAGSVVLAAPPPAPLLEAVDCHHPSLEGEAVAAVVADEIAGGRDPHEVVVVARSPRRLASIARALNRHAIPAVNHAHTAATNPHVHGFVALLRWVAGDDRALDVLLGSPLADLDADERHALRAGDHHGGVRAPATLTSVREELAAVSTSLDVARLAHRAFELVGRRLVPFPGVAQDPADGRGLEAIVAFVDDLGRQVELDPGLTLAVWAAGIEPDLAELSPPHLPVGAAGAVHLLRPHQVAGWAWPVLVVAGAVEGELPRHGIGSRFLDRALLSGVAPSTADRRRAALHRDRRELDDVLRRATARVVAVAPREPGVLMSRFIVDWPCSTVRLPPAAAAPPASMPPTTNNLPLHPDRSLRLSASQLDSYAACPRKYLYEYALRIRGDSNVWADLGTLVHDVLEEFVGPEGDATDLSFERLLAIVDRRWTDDIAEYRPQREEIRRDLLAMLEQWHEAEGRHIGTTLEVLRAERSFTIDVAGHTVTGRIDRVDRADDGVGIRILDYKTSKSPTRKDDLDANLQLRMYHLAALRDADLAALGPPSQLRLLFVRSMAVRDQAIAADHEAVTEALVEQMAGSILAESFEPIAGDWCRYCTVKRLCPLYPEGRDVEATA